MALQNYNEVIEYLKKKKRKPNLLLGNGFSMAFDADIFSYNALHSFIENIENPLLGKLFDIVNTKNFELVLQQLDILCQLIDSFSSDEKLLTDVNTAASDLKDSLIKAINELHPEHVFSLSEEQCSACANFLKFYLDNGGNIFSTNYDVLLYWVLMRSGLENGDGFGRDREDDPTDHETELELSDELRWGRNKDSQTIHYLHGALPLFDTGIEIVKEQYNQTDGSYIMENIQKRLDQDAYPIFVAAGNGEEKLNHIKHNEYLSYCYNQLSNISGSLVTFGFNFGEYDLHIIDALNRAALGRGRENYRDKLWSIYIGVYSKEDYERITSIKSLFNCKVTMFDAKSIDPWN